jgi:galactoside O-acetyltransferase
MDTPWLTESELLKFKKCGRDVKISRQAVIFGHDNIEIGDNVRIDALTTILATKGYLKLGNHIHIACRVLLSCGGGIELEDHTTISFDSRLISASDDFCGDYLIGPHIDPQYTHVIAEPILVKRLAQITTGCLVLPGAVLEKGAVLGAFSMLRPRQVLPAFQIAFGSPCQVKLDRTRKCEDLAEFFELEYSERLNSGPG